MAKINQVAVNFTTAGQTSPWIVCDTFPPPFCLTGLVTPDLNASVSVSVQYLAADFGQAQRHPVNLSQATTVITVNDLGDPIPLIDGGGLGHGLAVGDVVALDGYPGLTPIQSNIFPVATVTSTTVYTLTSSVSQTLANQNMTARTGQVVTGSATDPVVKFTAGAARASFQVLSPVYALRLLAGTVTTGGVYRLMVLQSEGFS